MSAGNSPGLTRGGQILVPEKVRMFNRCSTALVLGSVVAMNVDFANATYVSIDGSTTDHRRNCVDITADNKLGILAVSVGPLAVGAEGDFWLVAPSVPVLVPNGAALGNLISGTAGATPNTSPVVVTALTSAALDGLAAPTGIVGRVLEANSSGVTAARLCEFNGRAYQHIVGGGA